MLQFKNHTPFAGTILALPDPAGVDSLYTVVKATFTLGKTIGLAEEQVPVSLAARHYGEPDRSSIHIPSDISLMKPGTDVLLIGHAHAPDGRSTTQMDVSLRVGPISKRVRVFGDRVWRMGVTMSRPAPFDTMPLVWERAYGGSDERRGKVRAETRNPVGTGFHAPDGGDPDEEFYLPNLEDPSHLISSLRHSPPPACFAPIAPHWEPRRSYAGTFDERWQQERAPYLPDDFDPRFLQIAPSDQVAIGYLEGGETVVVLGATPAGLLRFRLPQVELSVDYVVDGSVVPRPTALDTVVIEPDLERVQLVWRSALACDRKALRVRAVHASLGQVEAA
jgi:hypothetical protein